MKARRACLLVLTLISVAAAGGGGPETAPAVCGRLTRVGPLPVLEVWGTPAEAGYAQGYLLGDALIRLFDDYVLSARTVPSPEVYEAVVRPAVARLFTWQPAHLAELEGILSGAAARLGPDGFVLRRLRRAPDLLDLQVANTLADWRGMLCSSFSAWGPHTADGEVLTGRNLDYPSTSALERAQLVVIHRGADAAAPAWLAVGWPGLIGAYTAMNSAGVTISMHDAPGRPPAAARDGYTPRSLALREALEAARAETFAEDVQAVLARRQVLVGNNIHVSAPRRDGSVPAVVFEYDGHTQESAGVTARGPATNGSLPPTVLACTNHMRSRLSPQRCRRYSRLAEQLAATPVQPLDPAAALRLIRTVAADDTLHSVVYVPHRRAMLVLARGVTDEPVTVDLPAILSRPVAAATQPAAGSASPATPPAAAAASAAAREARP